MTKQMNCSSSNNGAAVMNSGASPARRRLLFFTACVLTRLLLACVAFAAGVYLPRGAAVLAIVGGLVAAGVNAYLSVRRGCRWWYPGTSFLFALAAAVAGALVLAGKAPAVVLGALALGHVASGVAVALQTNPWAQ